jgi:hypothetical protein
VCRNNETGADTSGSPERFLRDEQRGPSDGPQERTQLHDIRQSDFLQDWQAREQLERGFAVSLAEEVDERAKNTPNNDASNNDKADCDFHVPTIPPPAAPSNFDTNWCQWHLDDVDDRWLRDNFLSRLPAPSHHNFLHNLKLVFG